MKHLVYVCTCAIGLLACWGTAAAQSLSVYGTVTDERGSPIEGAIVFTGAAPLDTMMSGSRVISGQSAQSDHTGSSGRYRIDGLRPGAYDVTAYVAGMQVVTHRVTLTDRSVGVDFRLPIPVSELAEITITDEVRRSFGLTRLRPVDLEGVALYDAKKSEVVVMDDVVANLAANNSRQIYGRVAGLNIWESDGAGVQLGLGGRGLSPNRNSNFNTRQNGYDIAADALGYPESYYTPPAQAVKRVEIVRGAASLQYGTQFGGLLNFVLKDAPKDAPFRLTTAQSLGSFGLFNSFNDVGGRHGAASYYGYYHHKQSDGWRPNSEVTQHNAFGRVQIELLPGLTIRPEFTYMHYLAQQPGGLTDAQFEDDPRHSTRERNWFRVDWNLLALRADYRFSSATSINTRFFGLRAARDAVGNLGRVDRLDHGGRRDLLRDDYRNWGNETRIIHRYPLLSGVSVLLAGTRYYSGFTHRRQGDGTAGSDPDFAYVNPDNLEGSDFDLPSRNVSAFAENIFNLTPRLSVTPGIRFEYIRTAADGTYRNIVRDLAGNTLVDERIEEERERQRSFVFFGVGASYEASAGLELYANFSQNYRAINFNDIRVDIGSLRVDPDIEDERGFNVDLGLRGTSGRLLTYDISLFHLAYQDRIGTVLRREPNPQFNNLVDRIIRFRTNIADARIYGLESYVEADLYGLFIDPTSSTSVSLFTNVALISSEYVRSNENGVDGNEVELVPGINLKTGLTVSSGRVSASYQLTVVGRHYSDASNAIRTPTAIEGVIPAYHVMDVSAQYEADRYRVAAGVNNLADHPYFTRRATGYPGPGIIPADRRSLYLTLGLTL